MALGLLRDVEIQEAIRKGLIKVRNPEMFLGEKALNYIQPASMDLTLDGVEGFEPIDLTDAPRPPARIHPDLDENFVTLWPGHVTEVFSNQLLDYDGEVFSPLLELRSTLRRNGLDSGVNPYGPALGFGNASFGVRNAQPYPFSIEMGSKIAQILWIDKLFRFDADRLGYVPHNKIVSSGRLVESRKELEQLVGEGKLSISPKYVFKNGMLMLHAGNRGLSSNPSHVILRANNTIEGMNADSYTGSRHIVEPGKFLDIEVAERFDLSPHVGIFVRYELAGMGKRPKEWAGLKQKLLTFLSSGGWIDNGYRGPFSVQRKSFGEKQTIREGDVVGYAFVWTFDQPPEHPYGLERGSHFQSKKI